ncbi:PR-1-like protein [Anaeromyces robustus]|jgi:hypothetical protein|uniref:PR-1-like protein n=1 Tax=Anaeromyces robustus TaxID=1754192 RepID=A0A1Y1XHV0_9FUNG|nr:PR-1-like protein [Anaeromyces robustus]|eukprot:ORX85272.1 PR-1-like protein [Anaeromyces robustus]
MKLRFSNLLVVAALLCGANATLTEKEKDELLYYHEKTREAVGAPDMKDISWDDHLAAAAERYAKKCTKNEHSGEGPENLAWTGYGRKVDRLFNLWKAEKDDFLKAGVVSKYDNKRVKNKIGHYAQVVWAENTKVGCGLSECDGGDFYQLVCRYKTGNVIGQKVYSKNGSKSSDDDDDEKPKEHKTTSKKTTTKKTTTRKTTTQKTTTTTTKKTTTTTIKRTTTTVPKPVAPVTTKKVVNTTSKVPVVNTKIPSVKATTKALAGVTKSVTAPVATPKKVAPAPEHKVHKSKDEDEKKSSSSKKEEEKPLETIKEEEEEPKNNNVVTGVAITGSVVGAAAAFVFLKKNPKQYANLTRTLSRKTNSIKRGASVVTRTLTRKPQTRNVPVVDNANDYRVDFVHNMNYTY